MAPPFQISDWYGGRHTCHTASGATGLLADEVIECRARSVLESVVRKTDACASFTGFTARPVSIRRRVTVVPCCWRLCRDRHNVQSKPVTVVTQLRSVFTSQNIHTIDSDLANRDGNPPCLLTINATIIIIIARPRHGSITMLIIIQL